MAWKDRTRSNEMLIDVMHGTNHAVEREEARAELILQNRALVISIAKKYFGRFITFEDLVQEGTIGLIRAVEKFDPTLGYRFSTFAVGWIQNGIRRALSRDTLIGIPEWRRADRDTLPRVVWSLDAATGDEDEPLRDFLAGDMPDPEAIAIQNLAGEELSPLLAALSPVECRTVTLRYGLDGAGERSLEAIGRETKMSREGVRQVLLRAMKSLRKQASTELEGGLY